MKEEEEIRYRGLLDDIDALESYEAIAKLTTPNLSDFQSKDLLHALAVKSFVCMYDTGMGKTFMASAYVKALKNRNPNSKVLMFGTNAQMDQTVEKMGSIAGLKVTSFVESPNYVFTDRDIEESDVLLLTHGCLNVKEHMMKLAFYLDRFDGIIVDELHLVSNFNESRNAQMLQSILNTFEYRLGLTATPITTDSAQLAKALYMINEVVTQDWKEVANDLKHLGSRAIDDNMRDLYVVRQRPQNNHEGIPIEVPAMQHQIGATGRDLFYITKGEGATRQHEEVLRVIKENEGSPGLIYANRTLVQRALYDYLIGQGVRVAVLNGKVTNKNKRKEIAKDFRDGKFDVLITNVTTALDLDCDWVMMYEFTSHVKQYIGRAERGFVSKNLKVYFMFTKDTDEYDYFYRNVYLISQTIQDLLNVDFSEVIGVGRSGVFNI